MNFRLHHQSSRRCKARPKCLAMIAVVCNVECMQDQYGVKVYYVLRDKRSTSVLLQEHITQNNKTRRSWNDKKKGTTLKLQGL